MKHQASYNLAPNTKKSWSSLKLDQDFFTPPLLGALYAVHRILQIGVD